MQLLLSPAKLMNFNDISENVSGTTPLFMEKTEQLLSFCQTMSVSEIAQLLKVNSQIAHDVYGYFQTFYLENTLELSAAYAFNGIAYKGLHIHDFTTQDLQFAQDHLNILSGLYGLLRPLDIIKPYRLNMGTRLSPIDDSLNESGNLSTTYPKSNYLYGYWQKSVNDYLSEKLMNDDNVIINLSSNEYYKTIVPELLPSKVRIVSVDFKEQKDDRLKQVVVHSKKARGMMARFIIKNKISNIEMIKGFDTDGYFFSPAESSPNKLTFIR